MMGFLCFSVHVFVGHLKDKKLGYECREGSADHIKPELLALVFLSEVIYCI
jgi:hypothetical protein